MADTTALWSTQEAAAYWDQRHRHRSALASGGNVHFDEPTNEIFYAVRLGRLISIIGDGNSAQAPLRVLDAGCGKGWFARHMAGFGHAVEAIDASPSAVTTARGDDAGATPATYAVSTLSQWRPGRLYDVIYCVDVLFHITDDGEWRASVRNLADHVRLGGRLILADWDVAERSVLGAYQVVRARADYDDLLSLQGLTRTGFVDDGFRGSPVGYHCYVRTS